MKKFFITACMAIALFAMTACTTNSGIKAAKKLIDNPTIENYERLLEVEQTLQGKELEEYNEWAVDHMDEIVSAGMKLGLNNPEYFL
jgi:hypothetical protein